MSKRLKIILTTLFLIQMSVFAWSYWENIYKVEEIEEKYQLLFWDEFADPSSVYKLDLSNQNWTEIPDCFQVFTNVSDLNLSNNQLEDLPKWIENFKELDKLNLSKNNFSTFEVKMPFKQLTLLDLSYNKLSELNSDYLVTCFTLNLSYNLFKKFPEFGNQNYLHNIILSHNEISFSEDERRIQIPQNGLKKLDLSYNNIRYLPKISTYDQRSLKSIDVSHNPIQVDEFEFGYKVEHILAQNSNEFKTQLSSAIAKGELENLKYLDLRNNDYAIEISDSNFYSNEITAALSEQLTLQLNNLKSLKLSDISHEKGVIIRHKKLSNLTIKVANESVPIYINCENLRYLTVNKNSLNIILKTDILFPKLWELEIDGELYEDGKIINEVNQFKQKYPNVKVSGLDEVTKGTVERAF